MMYFTQAEQEAIAETGFFTSLLSYVLFWTLDVLRPGFVARFFSVHVFLVGLIVFGVWWGAVVEEYTDRPRLQHAVLVLCGVCVSVRGGYAVVQLSGYVKVKSDKKIAVGYKKLSATAAGGVSVTTTGREYLVLDSTDTSVGFIL